MALECRSGSERPVSVHREAKISRTESIESRSQTAIHDGVPRSSGLGPDAEIKNDGSDISSTLLPLPGLQSNPPPPPPVTQSHTHPQSHTQPAAARPAPKPARHYLSLPPFIGTDWLLRRQGPDGTLLPSAQQTLPQSVTEMANRLEYPDRMWEDFVDIVTIFHLQLQQAKRDIGEVGGRAEESEKRAEESEKRVEEVEGRLSESVKRVEEVESRLRASEQRAKGAEQMAQQAEKQAERNKAEQAAFSAYMKWKKVEESAFAEYMKARGDAE